MSVHFNKSGSGRGPGHMMRGLRGTSGGGGPTSMSPENRGAYASALALTVGGTSWSVWHDGDSMGAGVGLDPTQPVSTPTYELGQRVTTLPFSGAAITKHYRDGELSYDAVLSAGGSGSLTLTFASGVITGHTIDDNGSNGAPYTVAPTITVTKSGGGTGAGAALIATIDGNGLINGVSGEPCGSNYTYSQATSVTSSANGTGNRGVNNRCCSSNTSTSIYKNVLYAYNNFPTEFNNVIFIDNGSVNSYSSIVAHVIPLGIANWVRQERVDKIKQVALYQSGTGSDFIIESPLPENSNGWGGNPVGAGHLRLQRWHRQQWGKRFLRLDLVVRNWLLSSRNPYPIAAGGFDALELAAGALPPSTMSASGQNYAVNSDQPIAGRTGAAAPSFTYDGDIYVVNTGTLPVYKRMVTNGTVQTMDAKHRGKWFNKVIRSDIEQDWVNAMLDPNAPPVCSDFEGACPISAGAGTVVGTVQALGNVTAYYLWNTDGSPNPYFTIGKTTGVITRTATAGWASDSTVSMNLIVEMWNGSSLVSHCPATIWPDHDGFPFAPPKRTIAAPGGMFAMDSGIDLWGVSSTTSHFWFRCTFNPSTLANAPYLFNAAVFPLGTSRMLIQILANGTVHIVTQDPVNAQEVHNTGTGAIVTGAVQQLAISQDRTTGVQQCYVNGVSKTLSGTVATSNSSIPWGGLSVVALGSSVDTPYYGGNNLLQGDIYDYAFGTGAVDWSQAGALAAFNDPTTHLPVSRTAFAAIQGDVPKADMFGPRGVWARGTNQPFANNHASTISSSPQLRTAMT